MSKEFKFKKTEQVVSYATIIVEDNTNEDEARERVKNNGDWVEFSRVTDGDVHYVGMKKLAPEVLEAPAEAAIDGNASLGSEGEQTPASVETEAQSAVSEAATEALSDEQEAQAPAVTPEASAETQSE